MPESDSQFPQIRLAPLLGLNQRTAANSTPNGEWETLDGLYPDQYGQLSRIPGKQLYTTISGNPTVLSIVQTNDGSGNILVQTSQDLRAYTLDELLGRAVAPNITPTPLTDDDTMPQAIIVQREANNVNGGSLRGWLSGSDTSSANNTYYGRRLTDLLINESTIVVAFTASTGGTAADSTPGTFQLAPGTYRIRSWTTFNTNSAAVGGSFIAGLYNNTAGRFEYHNTTGGSGTEPIVFLAGRGAPSTTINGIVGIETTFTITGSNQTYQLMQSWTPNSGASTAMVRSLQFGGFTDSPSATVNGSVPKMVYTYIALNKIA